MLAEYKYQHMRILPADLLYRIVRTEDGTLLLDRKVVTLANAADADRARQLIVKSQPNLQVSADGRGRPSAASQ